MEEESDENEEEGGRYNCSKIKRNQRRKKYTVNQGTLIMYFLLICGLVLMDRRDVR